MEGRREARASNEDVISLASSNATVSGTTDSYDDGCSTRSESLYSLPSNWQPNGWSLGSIEYDVDFSSDESFFTPESSICSFELPNKSDSSADLDLRPGSDDEISEWTISHDPLVEAINLFKDSFNAKFWNNKSLKHNYSQEN